MYVENRSVRIRTQHNQLENEVLSASFSRETNHANIGECCCKCQWLCYNRTIKFPRMNEREMGNDGVHDGGCGALTLIDAIVVPQILGAI